MKHDSERYPGDLPLQGRLDLDDTQEDKPPLPETVLAPPWQAIPVAAPIDISLVMKELERTEGSLWDGGFIDKLAFLATAPFVHKAKQAMAIPELLGADTRFGHHVTDDVLPDTVELLQCPECFPRFLDNLANMGHDVVRHGEIPYVHDRAMTLSESIADAIGSSRSLADKLKKGGDLAPDLSNTNHQRLLRNRQAELVAEAALRMQEWRHLRAKGKPVHPVEEHEFVGGPPVYSQGPRVEVPNFGDKGLAHDDNFAFDARPRPTPPTPEPEPEKDDVNDLGLPEMFADFSRALPIGSQLLPGLGDDKSPDHVAEIERGRTIAGAGGYADKRCVTSYVRGFQPLATETPTQAQTRLVRLIADGLQKGNLVYCDKRNRTDSRP